MKWLILRIYDHVSHLEECEVVENILGNIMFKISNEVENNDECIEQLKVLYYSIINRIEEVKSFNKRYSFDSRVGYFIKIVKLLEKTIFKIRNLNIIEFEVINNIKRNSKLNTKKSVLGVNTEDINNFNIKTNNLEVNDKKKNDERSNLNINNVNKEYEIDKKIDKNMNKKMSLKYDEDIYSKVMNEDLKRKKYSVLKQSSGEKVNLNLNLNDIQRQEDVSEEINWKEIVFKVMLNPEEYNLLLQEKEKYTGKFSGSQLNSNMTGPNISNISKKLS